MQPVFCYIESVSPVNRTSEEPKEDTAHRQIRPSVQGPTLDFAEQTLTEKVLQPGTLADAQHPRRRDLVGLQRIAYTTDPDFPARH